MSGLGGMLVPDGSFLVRVPPPVARVKVSPLLTPDGVSSPIPSEPRCLLVGDYWSVSMKYQYRAISDNGETQSGVVDVETERAAGRLLGQQGLTVLEISPLQRQTEGKPERAKAADILQVFDELVTLIGSGVALVDAVDSLAEAQTNADVGVALELMTSGLQQGKSLSEVLQESKLRLPEYFHQLAAAGELTGKLASSLSDGVEQMRSHQELMSETRNALIYPSVLVASGVLAVGLVFVIVVPKFSNLLKEGVDLPFLASAVLRTGMFFNQHFLGILVVAALSFLFAASIFRRPAVRSRLLDKMSSWPVIGSWLVESETGRWTAVLSALLGNGVPLMESLQLANHGVRIPSRQHKLNNAMQAVKEGETLSAALKAQDALLPTAYNILQVGEKAGELPAMLKSLANLYEKSGKNRMKRMLILIEPLAILIIGGAIGTIILGIILAITSASDIPI